MRRKMALIPAIACLLMIMACDYIVIPEMDEVSSIVDLGWSAVVTGVTKSGAGDLHIDLAIQNNTGDWSAMQAVEKQSASLTGSSGKTTTCETVFVNTGGHRLAPGFRMRGYTSGTKTDMETQRLYVECKGAEAAPGQVLTINITYVTGQLNYYHQDDGKKEGKLEIKLDEVAADLTYPVAKEVSGVIHETGEQFLALSDTAVTLLDVQRTETGFQFTWENQNPTEFALKTHIGIPPVIGEDGIIYGIYEIMDMAPISITPAGDKLEWTTEVIAPGSVKGFYILLSVETGNMRQYANYAIDITEK